MARMTARVVSRRETLVGLAAVAGAAACQTGPNGPKAADTGALPDSQEPITPNASFYVTSCCGTPTVDGATWRLSIKSLGTEVAGIALADLEAMAARDREHTLECISAGPYHLAISNAVWTGLPLREILDALGVTEPAEAVEMKFTSADEYTTSIPVSDLDATWLVWRMNGEELPAEHGFPARLLVQGRYGMKNPKWLTEIDFVSEPYTGFWENAGWSNTAEYRANAFVRSPDQHATVEAGPVRVLGTAFAGSDPIARVDVRVDGGEWSPATLDYAPGADIWTLWHFDWEATEGEHVVQARCVTASGVGSADDPDGTSALDGYDGSMEITVEAV